MRGAFRSCCPVALLLVLSGCDTTKPIPVASVAIDPPHATLTVGKTLALTASVRDAEAHELTDRTVTWSTTNSLVLQVTSKGLVIALSPGRAFITATSEGRSASADIEAQPAVAFVVVSAPKTTIAMGEALPLTAIPQDASHQPLMDRVVTWTASTGAATVSATGLVTGVTPGIAMITATSEERTASIQITVVGPLTTVEVSPPTTAIRIGGSQQLVAIPKDAAGSAIPGRTATWTSSDDLVAMVSAGGLVSAVKEGRATITATVEGKSGTATVTVPPPVVLTAIDGGMSHTCALDTDGRAYCWGDNSSLQLGDGSSQTREMLNPVATAVTFTVVRAGARHSCGLATDGSIYCWGAGERGQLGTGNNGSRSVPGKISFALTFVVLTVGENHSCGLLATGAAYCWGSNENGQLGDGTLNGRNTPGAVAGSIQFASITAGAEHTCGITLTGAAYCWGSNSDGQLGASTVASTTPTSVNGGPYASISAGHSHTCALDPAGTAYCWGLNADGQLGDGSTSGSAIPIAVAGGRKFTAVSAGRVHTCGVATSGAGYCWGSNSVGQLGDGTTSSSSVPVPVAGGLVFSSISAASGRFVDSYYGYYYRIASAHSCGVTSSRVAYCWGDNSYGQLANPGAGESSTRPVKVSGQQ